MSNIADDVTQKQSQLTSAGVTILGSTGSIGVNTIDVVMRHPKRFRVVALTAHEQVDRLFEQCCQLHPSKAVMVDQVAAQRLGEKLRDAAVQTEVLSGVEALQQSYNFV